MLGKNEEAITRYERLMEKGPDNLVVVNRLNQLYWNEFLFEKVKRFFCVDWKNSLQKQS